MLIPGVNSRPCSLTSDRYSSRSRFSFDSSDSVASLTHSGKDGRNSRKSIHANRPESARKYGMFSSSRHECSLSHWSVCCPGWPPSRRPRELSRRVVLLPVAAVDDGVSAKHPLHEQLRLARDLAQVVQLLQRHEEYVLVLRVRHAHYRSPDNPKSFDNAYTR